MSEILLSILIPTVVGREDQLDKLLKIIGEDDVWLRHYINGEMRIVRKDKPLEIYIIKDDKRMSVGKKRDFLYKGAQGLLSWMVDDDDAVHERATQLILDTIRANPEVDCIGFKELCNINGEVKYSNFSYGYADWFGDGRLLPDGFHFHRTPFFKTPIRTSLCQQVGVADMRYGEDHDFARRIKPLLKSEVYIDEFIYHYNHNSTDHNERYGIK